MQYYQTKKVGPLYQQFANRAVPFLYHVTLAFRIDVDNSLHIAFNSVRKFDPKEQYRIKFTVLLVYIIRLDTAHHNLNSSLCHKLEVEGTTQRVILIGKVVTANITLSKISNFVIGLCFSTFG